MAFETTITENDLDQASQTFVRNLRSAGDHEPDLDVDGLSDSLLSRLLGLLGLGRKR